MLNTYIYHKVLLTCFGVCDTIVRETNAYLLKNCMIFAMLLHRLRCKI
jgi:hypothetical protein